MPDDTLGAFLDYFPEMRDLLRSTNSADNLLHLLLEDTAFSIDNIYALQYDTYGDDLVVAASVAAQTGNNMATLTSTVSNLGGSYLTIIDTIERMVVGEQEMQLSEHHLYGSSRLGIKNYLPRQVYAYWNNTDVIPVADTGSLLSRRPWYSLEYNDVINGLALSPYGSTDQTTSGSQHLAGQRQYEMTNHLGNVLATMSDLPYKSEGEVLQFRVNPALRAVYDYYPFGSLKPGRYLSDMTENCVTLTQSRWVVKYRDSTVWNTGWVSAPATRPNLGIAQQITLSSLPGNGISIEIADTAPVGGLMTAVQPLSVTPNVRQDIELNLQVVSGTFVLRVLEEVNGTDVLLGSLTVSDAGGGSDGTVGAPVSYSISILPSTNNVKLQVSSPITMGTVLCCAPRTMNGYWKKITVPYLEQENIVVTLCDSIGDKYRFGFNGQEKVNEIAGIGNHNTAEFWEYDTRLGRRWNVDPMEHMRVWVSPYNVMQNNPISRVDWSGALDNPIYNNSNGEFLGTDDKGLQGEAILMSKDNFKQGMSHSDAMKKGTPLSQLPKVYSSKLIDKVKKHQEGLKDRPDWDGYVTIDEGIEWAKQHPNTLPDNVTPDNSLYLDASKLDYGYLTVNDLKSLGFDEGTQKNVNLFNYTDLASEKSRATTYALGNTQMKLLDASEGTVKLFSDDYDWDVHSKGSAVRNTLIRMERTRSNIDDSHGFRVYIYGTGTLRKAKETKTHWEMKGPKY